LPSVRRGPTTQQQAASLSRFLVVAKRRGRAGQGFGAACWGRPIDIQRHTGQIIDSSPHGRSGLAFGCCLVIVSAVVVVCWSRNNTGWAAERRVESSWPGGGGGGAAHPCGFLWPLHTGRLRTQSDRWTQDRRPKRTGRVKLLGVVGGHSIQPPQHGHVPPPHHHRSKAAGGGMITTPSLPLNNYGPSDSSSLALAHHHTTTPTHRSLRNLFRQPIARLGPRCENWTTPRSRKRSSSKQQ
jgi:hypothetical protein